MSDHVNKLFDTLVFMLILQANFTPFAHSTLSTSAVPTHNRSQRINFIFSHYPELYSQGQRQTLCSIGKTIFIHYYTAAAVYIM